MRLFYGHYFKIIVESKKTKMMKMDIEKSEHVPRSSLVQVLLGLIVNFSSLAPSMSLGFSAIALPVLTSKDNLYKLTDSEASWVASVASIATPIGCFMSGPISDKYGRKATLLCNNVVCFLGWVVIAIAYHVPEHQYTILITGRLLTGLSTGLASMPAAVYMAEVSSSNLRGMFTTWNATSFSTGILTVYALGWILKDNWGMAACITAIFPLVGIVLILFYVSESPSWLISKNRLEEAKLSMIKIFGAKDYNLTVHEEFDSLMQNKQNSNSKTEGLISNLRHLVKRTCLKPFILILAFFFFQQFSGVFVIVFYAVNIVKEVRIGTDPYFIICLIAMTRVIAAIIVGFLSRKYGRRPLSLVSGAGMTLCMVLLAAYLIITEHVPQDEIGSMDWLPTSLLMIYFFSSTLGFLTMPFAMAAEVFPVNVRGVATGLVTCLAYFFNFIIVKVYPTMMSEMGSYYVFFFYGAVSLVGTIFIIVLLPETKGKTLQEIEEYFGKKKSKKVSDDDKIVMEKMCAV